MDAQAGRARLRFSLRSLLVAVTMCAIGAAAVARASHVTLGIVSIFTLVAFLVALSTAIAWTGPRRAFAIGFLAWGVPYAAIAIWFLPGEVDENTCKLATSQFLHFLQPHLQHQTGTQTAYGFSGSGGGFGGFSGTGASVGAGSPAGTGSGASSSGAAAPAARGPLMPISTYPLIEPSTDDWIPLGHLLWTWLFAICGGFVTTAIWQRK